MVTPQEIMTDTKAGREENSAILYAENVSQFSYWGTKSVGLYFC
jgi:hypothetical protein